MTAREHAGEPADQVRVQMHGESHDSSTFTQIGIQQIVPPAPPPLEVRYSLPPDTPKFTGRDKEIERIQAAVTSAAGDGGVVTIHAINGMPGVGKTALAIHLAHRLRARFPDRQLFIDLHAHAPEQDTIPPETALAELLSAVGVDAASMPKDAKGRAALWRDRMAGQRTLLVIDNAPTSEQVAPLLPAAENCLVLVTSRRYLGDLPGATDPVVLGVLPPDKATLLFLRLAPRAASSPPKAVEELVEVAGYLPLAISLLARVYAKHPSWTLADLASETRTGLLSLTAEKDSIAAAFDISYRHLPLAQKRLFRRLGVTPGPTLDAYAVAALAGIGLRTAVRHLDSLLGEGLLIDAGYHRYGMHDLIRRYARNRVDAARASEQHQSLERLLDYYQHTAAVAESRLAPQTRSSPIPNAPIGPPAEPPELADRTRALAWARAERANLFACLDYATRASQHLRVVALTAGLAPLLQHDGPWAVAITRHSIAIQSARHLSDRHAEASALNDLGVVHLMSGNHPGATDVLERALQISVDLGDQLGQANALSNLGGIRYRCGDYPGASEVLAQALAISRDLGDRLGQANTLNYAGNVRSQAREYPEAAEALEDALALSRDLGDGQGQARALGNLGVVRWQSGDSRGAVQVLQESLRISRELNDRRSQVNALNILGVVRQETGDYPDAVEALEEALALSRDLGDRLGQANALGGLGTVRQQAGQYRDAAEALEASLAILRGIGDQGGIVQALNEVGTLYRIRGDLTQAEAHHREALELAGELRSPWDEAHALAGLARCTRAKGHLTDAKAGFLEAQVIFQRIGAPEAADVTDEIGDLG